ncbi:hypothetical protein SAY87_026371 [Trapa incisa]|uniref:Histone chaperone domain-containing protein n=1 Tax=Trapa incisa TaxID=236973 RepID=A0AAN7GRV9_9MYRT|nr:hypothetical protein SAY87_026371 [Trapa incisa]
MVEELPGAGSACSGQSAPDIESQIKTAMDSRISHLRRQSDSLTFGGVRQLIEKDLGLEVHALDAHKSFINQCLLECLKGSDDAEACKDPAEIALDAVSIGKGDAAEPPQCLEFKKITTSDAVDMKGNGTKSDITKSTIMKAIQKRAFYIRSNAENVSMAGACRLLEEDLEIEKCALDPFKAFITQQLEKLCKSSDTSKPASMFEKKMTKRVTHRKASKMVACSGSDSSSTGEEEEEDEVRHIKKTAGRSKAQKEVLNTSGRKRIKTDQAASDSNTDRKDNGNASENDGSQSSVEKCKQKKEVSTPSYGKQVERLTTVIKSCGMSIPPSIYKKVKRVSEDKREFSLIKELEEILSREGLSSNPSEKEIKEVKRRKDRARELDGIDMSNVVSSSRGRTTSSYAPPPKLNIPDDSESEESEDSDDDGEDEDTDEEIDEGSVDSQSEDADEGELKIQNRTQ